MGTWSQNNGPCPKIDGCMVLHDFGYFGEVWVHGSHWSLAKGSQGIPNRALAPNQDKILIKDVGGSR